MQQCFAEGSNHQNHQFFYILLHIVKFKNRASKTPRK